MKTSPKTHGSERECNRTTYLRITHIFFELQNLGHFAPHLRFCLLFRVPARRAFWAMQHFCSLSRLLAHPTISHATLRYSYYPISSVHHHTWSVSEALWNSISLLARSLCRFSYQISTHLTCLFLFDFLGFLACRLRGLGAGCEVLRRWGAMVVVCNVLVILIAIVMVLGR